jgi:hypothetical protein
MRNKIQTGNGSKSEILREQVRRDMQQVPTMQAAALIVALVFLLCGRDIVPPTNIAAWVL